MNRNLQLAGFTGKLAYFTMKGTPLKKAIRNTMGDLKDSYLKKAFNNVALQLEESLPFWKALESSKKIYPAYIIRIIKAGEINERLAETLEEVANYIDEDEVLKRDVSAAVRYPAIPVNVLCLLTAYVFIFFMPVVTRMFIDPYLTFPLPTQIMIFLANTFRNPGFLLIFFGMLAIFDIIVLSGGNIAKKILYHLPLSGSLMKKFYASKTAEVTTLMMKNGIPLHESIDILSKDPDFEPVKSSLKMMSASLVRGKRFSIAAKESGMFPDLASWMFEKINNVSALEEFLSTLASMYRDDLGSLSYKSGKALAAILSIILFGAVAIVVISVFLPLYQCIGKLQ
ncbi:MAG: type II secretion system F family protein [Candidatus Eremiobacteraeota bacterium]|nr:type II secretion system F family protein [Candidatus Eremiobacteraeota bacterium]